MRVIWTSSDDQKQLVGSSAVWNLSSCSNCFGLDSFAFFEKTRAYLRDGKVLSLETSGLHQPVFSSDSVISSLHISSISSSFGRLFLVSSDGSLFACGRSEFGECGRVTSKPILSPVLVQLVAPLAACPHGVTVTSEELICVRDVRASEKIVCVIDKNGRLWCYGDGKLKVDAKGRIVARPLPLSMNAKVVQLVAGRNHFICLATQSAEDKEWSESELSSSRSSTLPSDRCEKCREEEESRLSILMARADKEAETRRGLEEMVISDEQASHSLISAAKNLRLELKSDSSQSSPCRQPFSNGAAKKRERTSRQDSESGIEMAPLASYAGSFDAIMASDRRFTYVSLDSLPATYMDSDLDCSSQTDYTSSSSSQPSKSSSPRKTMQLREASSDWAHSPMEVWTWGANEHGQLGHNDLITRREPFKISALSGKCCIKIAAGDNHSAALTASGELYVWGSNRNGQLKQTEQLFIVSPSLFRVGSQSSVLDVSASGTQTAVIVSGIDATPTVYLCGVKGNAEFCYDCPQAFRVSSVEKLGWPTCVLLLNSDLVLGICERNVGDESDVARAFALVFSNLRFAKFTWQLSDISQKLHERSHILCEKASADLLNKLTLSSCAFSLHAARLAESCRLAVCNNGITSVSRILQESCSLSFVESLFDFHSDFVDCVAFGCFADIDLGGPLSSLIDKLCLEYEAESTKQHRRLRKLYSKAFDCLKALRTAAESSYGTSNEDVEPRSVTSDWCVRWKAAEQQLSRYGEIADVTFHFWKRPFTLIEQSLKRPGRLVFWSAEANETCCLVKNVVNMNPKSYLPSAWTTFAVFSDAVALVERRDYVLLEFPLVWIEPLQQKNQHCVRIYGPENEIQIEFIEASAKADFLRNWRQWMNFSRHYSDRAVLSNKCSSVPKKRHGSFRFSSYHSSFKNCFYEGNWLSGKPHGSGRLLYPDGKEYKGHFRNGVIEGFGDLLIPQEATTSISLINSVFFVNAKETPSNAKFDVYTGCWHNGRIDGLASIKWANGGAYEGYVKNGLRNGHGVQRCVYGGEQQIYVGGWSNGLRCGYGVASTNEERYLGMWADDMRQGNGCVVSIDGSFHEGFFEKDRLVRGRLILQTNDGDFCTTYEGDFEKVGVLCGKGILQLTRSDRIEGQMNGSLVHGEVKIVNAVFTKQMSATSPVSPVGRTLFEEGPKSSSWAVPEEIKWKEIFEHFLTDDFGVDPRAFAAGRELDHAAIWSALAASMTKIRNGINPEKFRFNFDDRLEKIPKFDAPWSNTYYTMVIDFWDSALQNKLHPICRLVSGLVEVFTCSYNSMGANRALCSHAVLEFRSLISRIYAIMRLLFTSLPPVEEMHSPVPVCIDRTDPSDANSAPATPSCTFPDNSLKSQPGSSVDPSPRRQGSIEDVSSGSSRQRQHTKHNEDRKSVLTPACDFIVGHLFAQCYAVLFTMYSVRCAEADRRYWERVVYLNAYTDMKLLTYLEVNRNLWPIDIQNVQDLDAPLVRATARKKFYKSAIHMLQRISCEFNPTVKLAILAETFSEISTCVKRFVSGGEKHVWTVDDLLPAFMYVTVRAQLQHLGAEIRLIDDFTPQLQGGGQIELMFTTLKASYLQICREKSLP